MGRHHPAQGVLGPLAARDDVQRNAEKANDLVEWWILSFTHDDVHGQAGEVADRIGETIARRRRRRRWPAA